MRLLIENGLGKEENDVENTVEVEERVLEDTRCCKG